MRTRNENFSRSLVLNWVWIIIVKRVWIIRSKRIFFLRRIHKKFFHYSLRTQNINYEVYSLFSFVYHVWLWRIQSEGNLYIFFKEYSYRLLKHTLSPMIIIHLIAYVCSMKSHITNNCVFSILETNRRFTFVWRYELKTNWRSVFI